MAYQLNPNASPRAKRESGSPQYKYKPSPARKGKDSYYKPITVAPKTPDSPQQYKTSEGLTLPYTQREEEKFKYNFIQQEGARPAREVSANARNPRHLRMLSSKSQEWDKQYNQFWEYYLKLANGYSGNELYGTAKEEQEKNKAQVERDIATDEKTIEKLEKYIDTVSDYAAMSPRALAEAGKDRQTYWSAKKELAKLKENLKRKYEEYESLDIESTVDPTAYKGTYSDTALDTADWDYIKPTPTELYKSDIDDSVYIIQYGGKEVVASRLYEILQRKKKYTNLTAAERYEIIAPTLRLDENISSEAYIMGALSDRVSNAVYGQDVDPKIKAYHDSMRERGITPIFESEDDLLMSNDPNAFYYWTAARNVDISTSKLYTDAWVAWESLRQAVHWTDYDIQRSNEIAPLLYGKEDVKDSTWIRENYDYLTNDDKEKYEWLLKNPEHQGKHSVRFWEPGSIQYYNISQTKVEQDLMNAPTMTTQLTRSLVYGIGRNFGMSEEYKPDWNETFNAYGRARRLGASGLTMFFRGLMEIADPGAVPARFLTYPILNAIGERTWGENISNYLKGKSTGYADVGERLSEWGAEHGVDYLNPVGVDFVANLLDPLIFVAAARGVATGVVKSGIKSTGKQVGLEIAEEGSSKITKNLYKGVAHDLKTMNKDKAIPVIQERLRLAYRQIGDADEVATAKAAADADLLYNGMQESVYKRMAFHVNVKRATEPLNKIDQALAMVGFGIPLAGAFLGIKGIKELLNTTNRFINSVKRPVGVAADAPRNIAEILDDHFSPVNNKDIVKKAYQNVEISKAYDEMATEEALTALNETINNILDVENNVRDLTKLQDEIQKVLIPYGENYATLDSLLPSLRTLSTSLDNSEFQKAVERLEDTQRRINTKVDIANKQAHNNRVLQKKNDFDGWRTETSTRLDMFFRTDSTISIEDADAWIREQIDNMPASFKEEYSEQVYKAFKAEVLDSMREGKQYRNIFAQPVEVYDDAFKIIRESNVGQMDSALNPTRVDEILEKGIKELGLNNSRYKDLTFKILKPLPGYEAKGLMYKHKDGMSSIFVYPDNIATDLKPGEELIDGVERVVYHELFHYKLRKLQDYSRYKSAPPSISDYKSVLLSDEARPKPGVSGSTVEESAAEYVSIMLSDPANRYLVQPATEAFVRQRNVLASLKEMLKRIEANIPHYEPTEAMQQMQRQIDQEYINVQQNKIGSPSAVGKIFGVGHTRTESTLERLTNSTLNKYYKGTSPVGDESVIRVIEEFSDSVLSRPELAMEAGLYTTNRLDNAVQNYIDTFRSTASTIEDRMAVHSDLIRVVNTIEGLLDLTGSGARSKRVRAFIKYIKTNLPESIADDIAEGAAKESQFVIMEEGTAQLERVYYNDEAKDIITILGGEYALEYQSFVNFFDQLRRLNKTKQEAIVNVLMNDKAFLDSLSSKTVQSVIDRLQDKVRVAVAGSSSIDKMTLSNYFLRRTGELPKDIAQETAEVARIFREESPDIAEALGGKYHTVHIKTDGIDAEASRVSEIMIQDANGETVFHKFVGSKDCPNEEQLMVHFGLRCADQSQPLDNMVWWNQAWELNYMQDKFEGYNLDYNLYNARHYSAYKNVFENMTKEAEFNIGDIQILNKLLTGEKLAGRNVLQTRTPVKMFRDYLMTINDTTTELPQRLLRYLDEPAYIETGRSPHGQDFFFSDPTVHHSGELTRAEFVSSQNVFRDKGILNYEDAKQYWETLDWAGSPKTPKQLEFVRRDLVDKFFGDDVYELIVRAIANDDRGFLAQNFNVQELSLIDAIFDSDRLNIHAIVKAGNDYNGYGTRTVFDAYAVHSLFDPDRLLNSSVQYKNAAYKISESFQSVKASAPQLRRKWNQDHNSMNLLFRDLNDILYRTFGPERLFSTPRIQALEDFAAVMRNKSPYDRYLASNVMIDILKQESDIAFYRLQNMYPEAALPIEVLRKDVEGTINSAHTLLDDITEGIKTGLPLDAEHELNPSAFDYNSRINSGWATLDDIRPMLEELENTPIETAILGSSVGTLDDMLRVLNDTINSPRLNPQQQMKVRQALDAASIKIQLNTQQSATTLMLRSWVNDPDSLLSALAFNGKDSKGIIYNTRYLSEEALPVHADLMRSIDSLKPYGVITGEQNGRVVIALSDEAKFTFEEPVLNFMSSERNYNEAALYGKQAKFVNLETGKADKVLTRPVYDTTIHMGSDPELGFTEMFNHVNRTNTEIAKLSDGQAALKYNGRLTKSKELYYRDTMEEIIGKGKLFNNELPNDPDSIYDGVLLLDPTLMEHSSQAYSKGAILATMDAAQGTISHVGARRQLPAFFLNENSPFNLGADLYRDASDQDILNLFENDGNLRTRFVMGTMVENKNAPEGYKLLFMSPQKIEDIQLAKRLNASILPVELADYLGQHVNKFNDNARLFMRLWQAFTKAGKISVITMPIIVMQNMVESYLKVAVDTGSPNLQNVAKATKMHQSYRNIRQQIENMHVDGIFQQRNLDLYFRKNATELTQEQFNFIHAMLKNNPSIKNKFKEFKETKLIAKKFEEAGNMLMTPTAHIEEISKISHMLNLTETAPNTPIGEMLRHINETAFSLPNINKSTMYIELMLPFISYSAQSFMFWTKMLARYPKQASMIVRAYLGAWNLEAGGSMTFDEAKELKYKYNNMMQGFIPVGEAWGQPTYLNMMMPFSKPAFMWTEMDRNFANLTNPVFRAPLQLLANDEELMDKWGLLGKVIGDNYNTYNRTPGQIVSYNIPFANTIMPYIQEYNELGTITKQTATQRLIKQGYDYTKMKQSKMDYSTYADPMKYITNPEQGVRRKFTQELYDSGYYLDKWKSEHGWANWSGWRGRTHRYNRAAGNSTAGVLRGTIPKVQWWNWHTDKYYNAPVRFGRAGMYFYGMRPSYYIPKGMGEFRHMRSYSREYGKNPLMKYYGMKYLEKRIKRTPVEKLRQRY